MKLKLGKFEVTHVDGKVEVQVSTTAGPHLSGPGYGSAKVELERIDAIKLRNWLNDFITGVYNE